MKIIGWTFVIIAALMIAAEWIYNASQYIDATHTAWIAVPFTIAGGLLIFESNRKNQ